ncbi:immunoglobulin-like domain-containing protein [Chryseomicrobium imtechense]
MRHSLLLFVLLLSLLTGCSFSEKSAELVKSDVTEVNTLDEVSLEVLNDTLTPSGLTLHLINSAEHSVGYNGSFSLERKIEGDWYVVNDVVGGRFAFTDEGLGTDKNSCTDMAIDWRGIYGELDAGDYRILFNVNNELENYTLATEFQIPK